ncbi:uncharacterized protein RSE6_11337 [Rhynchosporium secalis]|uniref:Xylanolytic transcriptional activator regulatory domain-containing protein n=1 Tax=Rhynchosporium secalis TaxID=38038 RepID=A0A1E1MNN0_RHYSE|nr:uncharacterized protein RSE6_11337 [Rhynchosporium secalis]
MPTDYIDQSLAENEGLKGRSDSPVRDVPLDVDQRRAEDAADPDRSRRNPIVGEQAWFQRHDPIGAPIYLGEAACTAFAARLRRFLASNAAAAHIPGLRPSQIVDPVEREHRVRIWWTVYIFDRMWGSKMGIPNYILDEDIHVDMPTTISPKELHDAQFPDTEYATASLDLAKIAGEAITKTYSRKNRTLDRKGSGDGVSQAALTLAEACIHASKHTHSLIIHQWTGGALPIFGYFSVQYLFSSAMVLLMSSLISPDTATADMEAFEIASQILRCMAGDGNLTAAEFSKNLEEVKLSLEVYRASRNPDSNSGNPSRVRLADSAVPLAAANADVSTTFASGMNTSLRNAPGGFTTEMAFLEPTMQSFLAQSDFNLGLLNPPELSGDASSALYFWNTPQWTE